MLPGSANFARLTWQMRRSGCRARFAFDSQPARRGVAEVEAIFSARLASSRPAATPTVRSAGPTSPICARLIRRSLAMSSFSRSIPRLARPVFPLVQELFVLGKGFARACATIKAFNALWFSVSEIRKGGRSLILRAVCQATKFHGKSIVDNSCYTAAAVFACVPVAAIDPSSNIDNCAGVSDTVPLVAAAR